MKRWPTWAWLVAGLSSLLALKFLAQFPWPATARVLASTDGMLLGAAVLCNLLSIGAKGCAWHLLLKVVAPIRWRTGLAATYAGAAVNAISVSVTGEAARIQYVVRSDGVPVPVAISSVLWARAVEGMALAIFVITVFGMVPAPAWIRGLQIGLVSVLLLILAWVWIGAWRGLARVLPRSVLVAAAPLLEVVSRGRLLGPVTLDLVNCALDWAAFHLTFLATHTPALYTASLVAFVAAHLGGILRLTPGNVGVLQASVILGLLPFGAAPEQAVAAGLALQVVQVFPVLVVGTSIVGWKGLRTLIKSGGSQAGATVRIPG
jgi:uncharacterized membrane protein YbhN (UPF0104 family)